MGVIGKKTNNLLSALERLEKDIKDIKGETESFLGHYTIRVQVWEYDANREEWIKEKVILRDAFSIFREALNTLKKKKNLNFTRYIAKSVKNLKKLRKNIQEGFDILSTLQKIEERCNKLYKRFDDKKGKKILKKIKKMAQDNLQITRSHLEENKSLEKVRNNTLKLKNWLSKLERIGAEQMEKTLNEKKTSTFSVKKNENETFNDHLSSQKKTEQSFSNSQAWIEQRNQYKTLANKIKNAKRKGKKKISVKDYSSKFLRKFIEVYKGTSVKLSTDHTFLWIETG